MTEPAAILHRSLPENVYLLLRRKILNNEFEAGRRLIESAIALELGVSRSTVREALRQLSGDGLVDISPRRHSFVTRMSHEDIRDACYARFVLEAGAARCIGDAIRGAIGGEVSGQGLVLACTELGCERLPAAS